MAARVSEPFLMQSERAGRMYGCSGTVTRFFHHGPPELVQCMYFARDGQVWPPHSCSAAYIAVAYTEQLADTEEPKADRRTMLSESTPEAYAGGRPGAACQNWPGACTVSLSTSFTCARYTAPMALTSGLAARATRVWRYFKWAAFWEISTEHRPPEEIN